MTIAAGSQMQTISYSIFGSCPSVKRVDLSNVSLDVDLQDDFDELSKPVQIIYPGEDPNATPMFSFSRDQITTALEAAVAPYNEQMAAAGYTMYIRTGRNGLESVQIQTAASAFEELDTALLRNIAHALVNTPEACFSERFREAVNAFDFSKTGTIRIFNKRMQFEMISMAYKFSIGYTD